MPNSGPWGPPGILFIMPIFSYVNPQTPNMESFGVYEAYKSWEVSHLLSHQISCRMPPESCLGTRVMTIFINVTILDKYDSGGIRKEI